MNYQKHMKDNEEAKALLLAVIKLNLAKYIAGQSAINRALMEIKLPSDNAKKIKKYRSCLLDEFSKMFKKMANSQSIVNEGMKTFKIVFREELNIDELIKEVSDEHFSGNAFQVPEDNVIAPDDLPDEVRATLNEIISKMSEKGLDSKIKIEVIDPKADNFGLKPNDFENFGDFCRAVSAAREAEASGKSGETILAEAIIHKAETDTEEKPKEKLN